MHLPPSLKNIVHVPHRDARVSIRGVWAVMLVILAAVNLLLIGWSAYLFFGISRESLFVSEGDEGPAVITAGREEIRERAMFFRERDALLERYKETPLIIPNPSR